MLIPHERRWYRVQRVQNGTRTLKDEEGKEFTVPKWETVFVDEGATGSNRGPGKKGRRHRKVDVPGEIGTIIRSE